MPVILYVDYDGKGHTTLAPDPTGYRVVLAGARLAHVNTPHRARSVLPVARELGGAVACGHQDVVASDDPCRLDFSLGADDLFFPAANHPDPAPAMGAYWRV